MFFSAGEIRRFFPHGGGGTVGGCLTDLVAGPRSVITEQKAAQGVIEPFHALRTVFVNAVIRTQLIAELFLFFL